MPYALGSTPRPVWVGVAYAAASGLMLGAGYLLMVGGLVGHGLPALAGALAGVGYTAWVRRYAGLAEFAAAPAPAYRLVLEQALHSSAEGVAIGAAMARDLGLGVFLAVALAAHNVGEGLALVDDLRRRGAGVGEAAGLAVVAKSTQPLFAVAAFAVAPALGAGFPAALGFAAGALLFLVLTELLPASYRRAPAPLVATLVAGCAAAVVLLENLLVREVSR